MGRGVRAFWEIAMIHKSILCGTACWTVVVLGASAQTSTSAKKADYTEFSRLIQKVVVSQLPKVYEGTSGWGQTIPIPDRIRLRNLRTVVKVGDHLELPHGHWRKTRVWMDDPQRDLIIEVQDLKQIDPTTYHVKLEVDAPLRIEAEVQQWQRGLALADFTAKADADVTVLLECDVQIALDATKFPPEVKVKPTVTDVKPELNDLSVKELDGRRLKVALSDDKAREIGSKLRGVIQDLLVSAESTIKERANEAIARSLQEGKGSFSAAALLKALTPKDKK
jgi:hypothetical protein